MEAFATVEDLQAGWRTLTEQELPVAGTLLLRASAYLTTKLANRGIEVNPEDEVQAINLRTVACNMARRSMASASADGISQVSQTVGSTSATVQVANPDGAFYLSRMDKEILGLVGGGRIGWAPLARESEADDGDA